jgi:NAD(P)-dependent dehydrogenase (short-subunit alcohol dehydrogenase family)
MTETKLRARPPFADRAVLVAGANRGLGRALVEEALRRGAKRAYAGTRWRSSIGQLL